MTQDSAETGGSVPPERQGVAGGATGTASTTEETSKQRSLVDRFGQDTVFDAASMIVYATILLLTVVVAASVKEYVSSSTELAVVAFGASLGLVVAHMWSGIVAHVLVRSEGVNLGLILRELRDASFAFVPAIVMTVVMAGTAFLGVSENDPDPFDTESGAAILSLTVLLVALATEAAHRIGRSWLRSLGWGLVSGLIGMAVVMIKEIAGA